MTAALAVFVLLGSLLVVRLVMSSGSVDEHDRERREDPTANTLPVIGGARVPPPTEVRLGEVVDGRREVTWTHEVDNPEDFHYLVRDVSGRTDPVSVRGVSSASVDPDVNCVDVVAISSAGSSDEDSTESLAQEC